LKESIAIRIFICFLFWQGLSFERFLRILLKFDSIGYMPYLRQILTSKPQKSSHDTSPYRFMFKFGVKFANLSHRDPHLENVNLKTCGAIASNLTCTQCSNFSRRRGWGIVKGEGSDFVIQAPSPLTRKDKKTIALNAQ